LTAGFDKLVYLPYTTGNINGWHFCHRLNDDGSRRADYNPPDLDGFRFSSFEHIKIVACFMILSKLKYARATQLINDY